MLLKKLIKLFQTTLYSALQLCIIIVIAASWSSGEDAALSRQNQGFDSPWGYQYNKPIFLYWKMGLF